VAKADLYVAHVRGTVKGGVDVALGPKTLIVGVNGAGKSRVVNALELALSGYASDVVGRPHMKSGSDLIALAPPGEPLHAVATLNDGRSSSFKVARKPGGKTSKPAPDPIAGLHVVYPAPAVVKALRGNVTTARTFVLQHSGLDITLDGLAEKIPAKLRDDFLALREETGIETPLVALVVVREAAKKAAKKAKDDAAAAEEIVGDAPDDTPDEADVAAAREAVRSASAAYEVALALPESVNLVAMHGEAVRALEGMQRQEAEVAALRTAAGEDPAEEGSGDAAAARHALHTLLTLTATHTPAPCEGPCLLCGQTAQIDPADYAARANALATADHAEKRALEARRLLPGAKTRLEQITASTTKLVAAYQGAHAAQSGGTALDRNTEVSAAYGTLSEAEERSGEIARARGQAEAIEAAKARIKPLREREEHMGDLATVCGDLSDDLVKEGREGFIARVQRYLPEGDVFDLVLRENKREVCMFGFRRNGDRSDGTLHTTLSGAEWARLTLALGAACIPKDDNVLAILSPEERAYDGSTLAAVMRALSDAPGQVIITSPIKPRGRKPAGWTIIEAGDSDEG